MVNADHVPLMIPRVTLDNPLYLRNAMIGLMTGPADKEGKDMTVTASTTEIVPAPAAEIVPVPPPRKMEPVAVDLDHLREHYKAIVKGRADIAEMQAYVAAMEAKFTEELVKFGATDAKINGRVVLTNRPAASFRYAEFREAHGDIYNRYLKPEVVDKLDKAALQRDHAGLLEPFRTTVLSVK